MNPLDIVRRTPKTNCGKCGHPTCLAFAAAVAKSGEDSLLCPFLDRDGLTLDKPVAGDLDNLAQARDLELIEHLKSKIAPLDFSRIARPLGAAWEEDNPDTLVFPYLGKQVRLSKSGILINQQEPEEPRDQILLYNYAASGGGRSPDNTWIGLESLPNSISKVRTLAVYCEDRLAGLFSGIAHGRIVELAGQLNGVPAQSPSASVGLIIPVLPMVPHHLLFWDAEPEDGFAAKVKILFDHHVMDFLDIESLVFAAERLAERVAELPQ